MPTVIFDYLPFGSHFSLFFCLLQYQSVLHACFEHIKVTIVVVSEFIVGAKLQDVAIANDKENVAVSNSAEAMSDDDRSSSFHSSVESLLNNLLTLLIQSRCCFI